MCRYEGFLLLFIYAMINMNIVSWGTREVTPVDEVDVDLANRVKQPNAWRAFIHEVYACRRIVNVVYKTSSMIRSLQSRFIPYLRGWESV